jgi:molybdopterin/thiamine biosynthesis adenylyltransferase
MNDQQLLRYSRHILLNEIGVEGQQRLLDAKVLVIGLGGLGSPAALYLAASGVGKLTLCDHDTVDFSNLQRQIIHRTSTVNQPKVVSAKAALYDINPEVECIALDVRADAARCGAGLQRQFRDALCGQPCLPGSAQAAGVGCGDPV